MTVILPMFSINLSSFAMCPSEIQHKPKANVKPCVRYTRILRSSRRLITSFADDHLQSPAPSLCHLNQERSLSLVCKMNFITEPGTISRNVLYPEELRWFRQSSPVFRSDEDAKSFRSYNLTSNLDVTLVISEAITELSVTFLVQLLSPSLSCVPIAWIVNGRITEPC